eukprot:CAMPEP_0172297510 /NCGR_PEP_ID=MMETSP1058-20130122/503_1 /TAXON_ID=83371 /ORGANISM="Detonula confervacea, Strain CCMP 353" /LENGTH=1884 /DNA_ID=CAMNT_0013006671 /DNA_START=109 /DNA_END=5763 /DNA_ORIENTATION=-
MVLGWRSRSAAPVTSESTTADASSAAAPSSSHEPLSEQDTASDQSTEDEGEAASVEMSEEEIAAAASLGSASEFCARNGLTDGGPASTTFDDGGQLPQEGIGGAMASSSAMATAPPLFPSLASAGGIGVGIGQQQQQPTPVANFPTKTGPSGIWPPSSEKSKKMKRDRSGNSTSGGSVGDGGVGGSGSGAGGNVTRIDVYPNGESYVTSPDGTTTKTMATIQQSSSAPAPASPIFQFTSNTTAAASSGGGSQTLGGPNNGAVTPQTATAALNFGKGFAPGVGAQGISPPANNSHAAIPAADDAPLDNNSLQVATNNPGGSATGPISPTTDTVGESSTTLATTNNSPLPIHWQPQSQTSTCEFTHTISNYSQKRDSGCKKAEYSSITTDSHGNKWRLIIYVNGNGRASNHHLSLFLQVADAEELPFGWNKAVSYVLTLEHPQGQSLGYAKRNPDKTFKLCPKAIDWGWSQFITSDRIQQEGYVNKNTLTVRASVTVKSSSVQIDPEDAELYLKCAVEEGNAEAVKVCLGQEARVNCQFKDDLYTPLHTACSANNHGDGNHGSSSSSSTPTNSNSAAPGPISAGSLEVLDLLLERGADVNACNKWRETPLLIAANNGHVEAVKRLLLSGADPSLCSEAGWSALTFAAHKGYDDICGLLLAAQAPVNCRVTEDLSTPLHKACAGSKAGHTSAVSQLLEGHADVHALNKWRETPLLTAANHGQSQAVEALLRYGADPCKCTDTGWSPLSIAAYKGHDEVVRLLLEEGAPTEEDDPTLSALLQAATKGLPDTVMLLLRHGADHTVTTKKGDTALSILVEQNLIDAAVEMVTDYSASVPRCSRDRKKVQRARLLINLRLKQMQRDGTGPYCDDSDQGESDAEPENGIGHLHDDADSAASPLTSGSKKKKKIKGGQKSIAKQEAEARAAEEALLLELEAEENAKSAAAAASECGSSKNSKKKRKKKEKERQQKAEKALEDELLREVESKGKEEVEAATAAQAPLASKLKMEPSLVKKEKVVELTSQTVVQTQKQKKKQDNMTSTLTKKSSHNKEASLPSSSDEKQESAAESKLNLKWAEGNKEVKPKKVREVLLPKPGESTKKTSSNRNKANHHATKGNSGGANKKIPGDNPPPKKIPGDNPIQSKIAVDNPVIPRKIPGDNPIQPKKIPGDNPKVPVQQSRGQNAHTKGGATPAKNKRGWESKANAQQQSSASAANKKKSSKQSQQEKSSGKKGISEPASTNKNPPASDPNPVSPAARSDESTHSTANSTADSLPATPTPGQKASLHAAATGAAAGLAQIPMPSDVGPEVSVDDQLANMANDVLGFLDFDSSQPNEGDEIQSSITPPPPAAMPSSAAAAPPLVSSISVELPSVSIYRLEKLNEIFRHCSEARSSPNNPLRVIDERTLRVVLYRWIIRASHGSESFLDPVIPSWDDEAYLKAFLQRQFISEGRRPAEDSRYSTNVPSIEVLRDAGAAMSEICISLARDVVEFRSKCEQQVPSNWSDSDINVAGMEEGSNVVIEWSGKSRLSIPFVVFSSLARRYVGERSRLMSAIFSTVRRHEMKSAIADQTDMVCHLPLQTMECLTKGLSASLETWSDSVSVYGNNYFCAMFPDVDTAFGGLTPFGKENGGGESILNRAGGSVIVVAPPENATSSQCIRKMVDMSETLSNLPLSFGVVLSSDCFVNANATLSAEDLRGLDPRLCGEKKSFISYIEVIPAGSSTFSKSSCMFLLIQNEAGKLRFPIHPTAMDMIRRSMRSDIGMGNNAPMMSNLAGMQGEAQAQFDATSFSPMSQHQHQYAAAPQEAPLSSNPWGGAGGNRGRGHRGRLFELVGDEDAEEDQGMDNILPGMLDGLGVNMFGSSNTNDEVDIEAISLMGFGLNGAMGNYNQP